MKKGPSEKTNLELDLSVLGQIGKVDSSAEKDGGGLRDPIHLPAQVLEKGGEPRLAGGLASTRSTGQDQFPDFSFSLLLGHDVFEISEYLHFGRIVIDRGEKQRK